MTKLIANSAGSAPDKPGSLPRAAVVLTSIARGSSKGSLLTELIKRERLPRTTIVRALQSLMELGWVVKDEDSGRYNLGPDLAALGYSAVVRNPLERIAHTELSLLAGKLNQLVYLSVRSGLDMVCIGRYESKSQIQIGTGGPGQRGPFGMTQCCTGIMARMPPAEVYDIVEANMARYHRVEGFDELGFRKTVAAALKDGYGTYDNIILDRTASGIGVAIVDHSGFPVAGIGTTFLSGWLSQPQWEYCLEQLQQTAARISQALFKL